MAKPRKYSDPRRVGGAITGPIDNECIIDARRAVLVTGLATALIVEDGAEYLALELEGRINRTNDEVRMVFIMDPDGWASLRKAVTLEGEDVEGDKWVREP